MTGPNSVVEVNANTKGTDIDEFLDSLDGGCYKTKIKACLDDIAMAVVATNGAGKLTITLDVKAAKGRDEVNISHKLVSVKPTRRGKQTGEDNGSTPMFVGKHGRITLFDETQQDMFAEQQMRNMAAARETIVDSESVFNPEANSKIDALLKNV